MEEVAGRKVDWQIQILELMKRHCSAVKTLGTANCQGRDMTTGSSRPLPDWLRSVSDYWPCDRVKQAGSKSSGEQKSERNTSQ
jgi:hypothetical protein